MTEKAVSIRDIEITLTGEDIVSRLTNNKRKTLTPKIDDIVVYLMEQMGSLFEPRMNYMPIKIENISGNEILLRDGTLLKSAKLGRTLQYCDEAVCFIGTIGEALEKKIKSSMKKGLFTEAYILDAIGSAAAESMIENFYKYLREKCTRHHRGLTLRFSPGYCDWNITEQKKFFSIFNECDTGVHLTDSMLMVPRKSISGVIGTAVLQDNLDVVGYNPCCDCLKKNCHARRAKYKAGRES